MKLPSPSLPGSCNSTFLSTGYSVPGSTLLGQHRGPWPAAPAAAQLCRASSSAPIWRHRVRNAGSLFKCLRSLRCLRVTVASSGWLFFCCLCLCLLPPPFPLTYPLSCSLIEVNGAAAMVCVVFPIFPCESHISFLNVSIFRLSVLTKPHISAAQTRLSAWNFLIHFNSFPTFPSPRCCLSSIPIPFLLMSSPCL